MSDNLLNERYVLGCMLLDFELAQEGLRRVTSLCFTSQKHKTIIKAIRVVRGRGNPPSVGEVGFYLAPHNDHAPIYRYLSRLADVDVDKKIFFNILGWLEAKGLLL